MNGTPPVRPSADTFPAHPQFLDGVDAGPEQKDFRKVEYEKKVEGWLEAVKTESAREDALKANEATLREAIHTAYIDVAKSSLDRAVTRVNIFTAAIGSVITIYTALLALVYTTSDKDTNAKAIDAVAFVPALFLGTALLLVSVYSVLFRKSMNSPAFIPSGIGGNIAENRLVDFVSWCFGGILARRWALHAGLVAFAFGIVTLPITFVDLGNFERWAIFVAGCAAVALTGVVSKQADAPDVRQQLAEASARAIPHG